MYGNSLLLQEVVTRQAQISLTWASRLTRLALLKNVHKVMKLCFLPSLLAGVMLTFITLMIFSFCDCSIRYILIALLERVYLSAQ